MTARLIEIVPYRTDWPLEFQEIARLLRTAAGSAITAIHHIGSTAVPGLAAKDIIDVQITVSRLDNHPESPIAAAGFKLGRPTSDHCPQGMSLPQEQLAKRLYNFAERPANVHVREAGRFNQRYPLLCRDYLRTHPDAANAYGAIKRQLAEYFSTDPDGYYAIKDPTLDLLMAGAEEWATSVRWTQPSSD